MSADSIAKLVVTATMAADNRLQLGSAGNVGLIDAECLDARLDKRQWVPLIFLGPTLPQKEGAALLEAEFRGPVFFQSSTNGLAARNHLVEATLHALYELIEHHAMARLTRGGVSLPRGGSRVVDLDTVPAGLMRPCGIGLGRPA